MAKTELNQSVASNVEPFPLIREMRTAPHNYEAEQALLGALLHNNSAYEKISEFLRPDHFADSVNGRIFAAIERLIERGQVADPITLKDYFEQDQSLKEIGGVDYLAHLATSVVSVLNIKHYGELIYDLHLRRHLISLGEDVVNQAYEPTVESSATEQIETAEQRLFDLASTGYAERSFTSFSGALTESIKMAEVAFQRDSHIVGTTTGLTDLDKLLGGLHPSDLLILAGRPSMGKTALATNVAFNAAKAALKKQAAGATVAFFSLEMSSEQLATRLLAQEAGVSSDHIRRGAITKEDFPKFTKVARELAGLPLYIDDTPALTVSALRTRARRLKRKQGLDCVIIDYLQLIQGNDPRGSDNRVQELSQITRSLKALAKELNVPVLALSQLSRQVEQREDKRPQLADLRESGSIEQDADVVMFVYREEYYESRKMPPEGTDKFSEWQDRMNKIANVAEIIVAKQRHGPISTVKCFFDGKFTKFSDLIDESRFPDGRR